MGDEKQIPVEITLGDRSQAWKCVDCSQIFVWHPGISGKSQPEFCGNCDSTNIEIK